MDFFKAQFTKIPKIAPVDLSQSTVLVTGANTGIGFEIAKELLKSRPQRLIIACRTTTKGDTAKKLLEEHKQGPTSIEVRELDQSNLKSVRSFAQALQGQKIHIAVLNAGVFGTRWEFTEDGYENDLQVNTLAPALLSVLLLPSLRSASKDDLNGNSPGHLKPHLAIVSSGLHEMAKFKESEAPEGSMIPTLNDRQHYNQQDRYPTSKMLGLLWTRELASRVPSEQVVINAPNPGFCRSGLMGNTTGVMKIVVQLFSTLFGRPVPDGARCIVDAVLQKGPESHGKYLTETKAKPEGSLVTKVKDLSLQHRVWDEIFVNLRRQDSKIEEPGATK